MGQREDIPSAISRYLGNVLYATGTLLLRLIEFWVSRSLLLFNIRKSGVQFHSSPVKYPLGNHHFILMPQG
jgi:hypothetical protein